MIPTFQQGPQDEDLTLFGICSDKHLIHLSQAPVAEEKIQNIELGISIFLLHPSAKICYTYNVMFENICTSLQRKLGLPWLF